MNYDDKMQVRSVLPVSLRLLAGSLRNTAILLRRAFPGEAESSQHADELNVAAAQVDKWREKLKKAK